MTMTMTTACAPSSVRREIIHEVLTRDNRDLALRDPREVAARFERMAADPMSFFRGSVTLWAQDTMTPGGTGAIATAFANDVAGGALLIGDPHPENFGTTVTSDGLQFGINDFDVARFGPVVLDVRRLALGFAVAAQQITASQDITPNLVGGVVDGYSDAMSTPLQNILDPTSVPSALDPGTVVLDLFGRAHRRGADHREFDDVTTVGADGRRHLVIPTSPPTTCRPKCCCRCRGRSTPLSTTPSVGRGLRRERWLASWAVAWAAVRCCAGCCCSTTTG